MRPATVTLSVLASLVLSVGAVAPAGAVGLAPVATGLTDPTYVAHAGDGSGRLFIVERPGRILVVPAGGGTPATFLDITDRVRSSGEEEGLLSVAFHPSYPDTGVFYVYYTNTAGDNQVSGFSVTADPNVADAATETLVLLIPHPVNSNHNGGQLQFGPDGFLYVGTGDGGAGGDPPDNAQHLETLLGKLLRVAADGSVPAGNPFGGVSGARPEIWALGLRNPFRFSFDRATGDLYVADVGQNTREEIDVQPAGSAGGANYCWRRFEGFLPFDGSPCTGPGTPTPPVLDYGHDHLRCSITGGYVYRGPSGVLPAGAYLFGDFCSGEIFTLRNGFATRLLDTTLRVSSFGEDEAGELYVADLQGTVSRLTGPPGPELIVGVDTLLPRGPGDVLTVGVGTRNPAAPLVGDAYAGVVLPDGATVAFLTSLAPSLALLPLSADPATFPPLARDVAVATGDTALFPLFAYTFTGGEPAGEYLVFVALVAPGSLADGSLDPGDLLLFASQPFTVGP